MSKPRVSVIVPCFNEQRTIRALLDALNGQSYRASDMEVIVADGMSTDGTRDAISVFARKHPELALRLVDNPDRSIPAALNRAIVEAQGETIIRLDAHSVPGLDYVARCLSVLAATGAANVGGAWEIRPSRSNWMARGIAEAAAHPLGAGDARYRTLGREGPVDTVPFGAYSRAWLARVGPFDERLHSNEDYELNLRLRKAGGVIWFDPAIRSVYYARGTLRELGRQYLRYGYWKGRMLALHPRSLRWRQSLPALFVLALLAAAAGATTVPLDSLALGLILAVYVGTTVVAGVWVGVRRRDPWLVLGFPLALWTMHICWGGSFWIGLLDGFRKRSRSERTD